MKLVWASDIHLDHGASPTVFGKDLAPVGDALILSGDIASGMCLHSSLVGLAKAYGKPIYFVLGNHDLWGSSFEWAARDALDAESQNSNLCWLRSKVVTLADGVAITGDDGWYDAYHGSADDSRIIMRDWIAIQDFAGKFDRTAWMFGYRDELIAAIRKAAAPSARRAKESLRVAAATHSRVIFVTHIPPFRELAVRSHDVENHEWIPWYCSQMMGDAILSVADEFPGVSFEVLCGHTHMRAVCSPRENVTARTAQATYAVPDYEDVILI